MSLSYHTSGNATAPSLLFLHGLGAGSGQIISGLRHLTGHYLITPDMPGHGESLDFAPDILTFDKFADLIIELMDTLGIESSNIGGLSMGSGITLNLALRYPERVKKIILLRPSWLNEKKPPHLKLVAYVGQWIEKYGVESAKERLSKDVDFRKIQIENKPVADSIEALFKRPLTGISTTVLYKMWQDRPFSDFAQLTAIPNQALIMTTSRDELHPESTASTIASYLPSSTVLELPPRYYEPKEYSKLLCHQVSDFLG